MDVGCVAHDVERMNSPQWLHGRIASVAARCVGVDVLADGISAMQALGFESVAHDLTDGLGPLADATPFDVIVAGELIEHVAATDMLFRAAAEGLAPDGELILTTPNPYAPGRVRAGRRGIVWENVDHIVYAFPSGIAELAERHGLRLSEAFTIRSPRPSLAPRDVAKRTLRWLRGTGWRALGIDSLGRERVRRLDAGQTAAWLRETIPRDRWFTGETFVYVVKREVALGG